MKTKNQTKELPFDLSHLIKVQEKQIGTEIMWCKGDYKRTELYSQSKQSICQRSVIKNANSQCHWHRGGRLPCTSG